jgi:hypothetical protein
VQKWPPPAVHAVFGATGVAVQTFPEHVTVVQPPAAGCAQSESWLQPPPTAHGGQSGPPQSVPVSLPFLIWSVHVGGGAWH